MATGNQAEAILANVKVSDEIKAAAYDAFVQAKTTDDLTKRLTPLALPDSVKGDLFDARVRGPGAIGLGAAPTQIRAATPLERLQGMISAGAELVPEIAGGIIGAGMGGPVGAGLGMGAGNLLNQVARRVPVARPLLQGPLGGLAVAIQKLREAKGEVVRKPAPPPARAAALEVAGTILGGMAGEYGGRGVVKLLGKLKAPFTAKVTPVAGEARQLGISMPPAEQVPSSLLLGGLQGRAEATVAGKSVMRNFFEQANKEAIAAVGALADTVGKATTKEEAGYLYQRAFNAGNAALSARYQQVSTDIFKQAGKTSVNMRPVKRMVVAIEERIKNILPGLKASDSKVPALLDSIKGLPDTLSLEEADALQSSWLADLRKSSGQLPSRYRNLEAKITEYIRRSTESRLNAIDAQGNTHLLADYRQMKAHYRHGKDIFERSFAATVAEKYPEQVSKVIWRKDAITPAKEVMEALTNPEFAPPAGRETWNIIRRRGIQDIMDTAIVGDVPGVSGGVIKGKSVVSQWESLGPDMQELLGGPQLAEIQKFMRVARAANLEKAMTLTGHVPGFFETGVALTTVGGILGGLTGQLDPSRAAKITATSVVILAAPNVAARLMTSKRGVQWLTEGLTVPALTSEGIKLLTRMAGAETGKALLRPIRPEE